MKCAQCKLPMNSKRAVWNSVIARPVHKFCYWISGKPGYGKTHYEIVGDALKKLDALDVEATDG